MTLSQIKTRLMHATLPAFMRQVADRFREVRGLQTAGSLAFTTLLALVPLLTVMLLVSSQFGDFNIVGEGLRNFLVQNLLPDRAGKVIATYAVQFSQKASNLTLVGTLLLVTTALMLLQTIDRTLNSIWHIRDPRRWYVRMPTYWVVLTLGPVIFGLGVFLSTQLISASLGLVNEPRWVKGVLYQLTAAALLTSVFTYLFHAVPNRRLVLQHGIIGGLIAALGVVLVQRLFGLYLSKLPNFTLIYGTFSVLPIFLLWLYLTWLMVLLGAIVAATLPDFTTRKGQLPTTPSGRLEAALRLLRALMAAQKTGQVLSLESLSNSSGMTIASAEARLMQLAKAGIAVRSDAGDWLLCLQSDQVTLGEALEIFLLDGRPRDETHDTGNLAPVVTQLRDKLALPLVEIEQDQVAQIG